MENLECGIVINYPEEGIRVSADANTAKILTGEHSGADELTDLGISYRELDRRLREEFEAQIQPVQPVGRNRFQFHLIRPKSIREHDTEES